jgi:hypothetical protein
MTTAPGICCVRRKRERVSERERERERGERWREREEKLDRTLNVLKSTAFFYLKSL